eukprot:CAMPEP_0198133050 /NCGR_PEP_ID=MMETSP1442-20131203/59363_1 /TAXON_ID= /ORGANISM="Craspedostauros australis, Strain CCMP3328" /LENGTH=311 /DNA_ID=CAMNT_0043794155 /DNA_START=27 /DNA_END=963 /DNA_ORIENTATION=-
MDEETTHDASEAELPPEIPIAPTAPTAPIASTASEAELQAQRIAETQRELHRISRLFETQTPGHQHNPDDSSENEIDLPDAVPEVVPENGDNPAGWSWKGVVTVVFLVVGVAGAIAAGVVFSPSGENSSNSNIDGSRRNPPTADGPHDQPSQNPTHTPTDIPSGLPSDIPSDLPSDVPSDLPLDIPSDLPSDIPSDLPSDMPSDLPSDVPSDLPSDMPSDLPSDVPSDRPSDVPSDRPSDVPIDLPSDVPSDLPSDVPSDLPSDIPSDLPSSNPTYSSDQSDAFCQTCTSNYGRRIGLVLRALVGALVVYL